MSNTPLDTSADVKVSEASHLSNVPLIATDASTSKVIALSTGVILNTGTPSAAWARLADASKMDAKIQKMLSRMTVVKPPIGLLDLTVKGPVSEVQSGSNIAAIGGTVKKGTPERHA